MSGLLLAVTVLCVSVPVLRWRFLLGGVLLGIAAGALQVVRGVRMKDGRRAGAGWVVVFVFGTILAFDMATTTVWVGNRPVSIPIRVLDGSSGQPIRNAEVWILEVEGAWAVSGNARITDARGRVVVTRQITCAGKESALGISIDADRSARFSLLRYCLVVHASGYASSRLNLAEVSGASEWAPFARPIPETSIVLERDDETIEPSASDPDNDPVEDARPAWVPLRPD